MEAWECPTCHSINPDNGRCSTCTSAAALCYSVYRGDPSGDGSSAAAKASSHPLAHLNAAPKVTPTPAPPAAPPRLGMWGHVRGYLPGRGEWPAGRAQLLANFLHELDDVWLGSRNRPGAVIPPSWFKFGEFMQNPASDKKSGKI